MFGLSFPELLVILGIALVFFGPDHLPELARKLGKFSGELRKTSDSIRREFYNSVYTPIQGDIDSSKRELTSLKSAIIDEFKPDPNCPDYQAKVEAEKSKADATPKDTQEQSSSEKTQAQDSESK